MADVINLNRARKDRDKAARKVQAAVNRAAHGRTKAERVNADRDRDRAATTLDGHRRDKSED